MNNYDRLEAVELTPKRLADHSALWAKLEPVDSVNGRVAERLEAFCAQKHITLEALAALGTRVRTRKGSAIELAFAGDNGNGAIVAVKYRPIGGSSHDSYAERPSTWLNPIVAGNTASLDWIICEGETDTARLFSLVGDACAILCLPAGAQDVQGGLGASDPARRDRNPCP